MQTDNKTERRRHPRHRVWEGIDSRLEVRTRVHLVDISASGALLGTELPLPIGTHASLHSNIANGPFTCQVEIRRHANSTSAAQSIELGAIFTEMDEYSRRSLEQFLKKASA